MQKLLFLFIFFLSAHISRAQSPLTFTEANGFLNKNKAVVTKALAAKGFFQMDELNTMAHNFANHVTEELGGHYTGQGYGHKNNYSVMVIFSSSGRCVGFQYGTKRPKAEEVKKLASTISANGFHKTDDREDDNGDSNLRIYDKADVHLTLSSIFDGGYTLSLFLNSVFK
jgi:hypothetical protein